MIKKTVKTHKGSITHLNKLDFGTSKTRERLNSAKNLTITSFFASDETQCSEGREWSWFPLCSNLLITERGFIK